MAMIDSFLQELEHEAKTTRRVLERVPDNQLGWRPHPKSRTLGELALHVAGTPGEVAKLAAQSEIGPPDFKDPVPASAAALIPALEESVATAKQLLGTMDDATLNATWRVKQNGRELLAMPRAALLRSIIWYHHRGQLSVYLRELGIPVPSIYGPSADENPFS